ncbi:MAG: CesT family type III secretion system chaperone [Prosthecobacter sp.]
MTQTSSIHHLMAEVGGVLDLAEVTESTGAPMWLLQWQDEMVLHVEFDEEEQRLTFVAEVGDMPADNTSIAGTLLAYNALWDETGGICMAVDNGVVLQLFATSPDGVDLPVLCRLMTSLHTKAALWRQLLQGKTAGASATENEDSILEMLRSGVRV